MQRPTRAGLTLVELLVVIAIIGLLAALVLPAIQSVRESARVAQCRNNARQLAVGCLTHLDTQGFWPSGGWGFNWTGEADRGFGKAQPGGWAYAVLPYVEQTALHQFGAGMTDATQRLAANGQRAATPVAIFYCPTRRAAVGYPAVEAKRNATMPAVYAKTDYAINVGDTDVGGSCLPGGPPLSCLTDYPGKSCFNPNTPGATEANWYGFACDPANFDGISTHRSEMPASEVVDGMTTTLLVAEKNLDPNFYITGNASDDNAEAWQGRDWDTSRWTAAAPRPDTRGSMTAFRERFGGPHRTGFVAAACDGAVRFVSYQIDPAVWKRLGNCQDTSSGTDITDWPSR